MSLHALDHYAVQCDACPATITVAVRRRHEVMKVAKSIGWTADWRTADYDDAQAGPSLHSLCPACSVKVINTTQQAG